MNPHFHTVSVTNIPLCHPAFNVLSTRAAIGQHEEYSLQSPEPSDPSTILTPPMNLSTIEGWETSHTTTDDNIFYSEGELRRVYWHISPNETFDSNEPRQVSFASSPCFTPPPPPRQKRNPSMGCFFPKWGSVLAHLRGMQPTPTSQKYTIILREKFKLYYY